MYIEKIQHFFSPINARVTTALLATLTAGCLTAAAKPEIENRQSLSAIEQNAADYVKMQKLFLAEQIMRDAYEQKLKRHEINASDKEIVEFENRFARLNAVNGRLNDAMQISQAALQIRISKLSQSGPELLPTLGVLFDCYERDHRYDKAETTGRRILSILQADKKSSPARIELWKAKMAHLADLAGASDQSRKLLAGMGRRYTSQRDRDLATLTCLTAGSIYSRHRDYAQAERWYRKALSNQASDKTLLKIICNQALAQLDYSRGNSAAAEKTYVATLPDMPKNTRIQEALIWKELARIAANKGTIGGTTGYYDAAAGIFERCNGVDSLNTVSTLKDLNDFDIKHSCFAAADKTFRRMENAYEIRRGPEFKSTVMVLILLGTHNRLMGRVEAATKQIKLALTKFEGGGDFTCPEYAEALKEMACLLAINGKLQSSIERLSFAIALDERLLKSFKEQPNAGISQLKQARQLLLQSQMSAKKKETAQEKKLRDQAIALMTKAAPPLPMDNCPPNWDSLSVSMQYAELMDPESSGF